MPLGIFHIILWPWIKVFMHLAEQGGIQGYNMNDFVRFLDASVEIILKNASTKKEKDEELHS